MALSRQLRLQHQQLALQLGLKQGEGGKDAGGCDSGQHVKTLCKLPEQVSWGWKRNGPLHPRSEERACVTRNE